MLTRRLVRYGVIATLIATLIAGLVGGSSPFAEAASPPRVSAAAWIVVDGNTGQVLGGHDIFGEFYPASITKIMTAYLAITRGWHDTVVVSPQAADQPGSSAYLTAGERLKMPGVVTAMMLVSGNDAAYAVAQTVAGSVAKFVHMMNAQAKAWGAPGIHFANPDGLPNPRHVVTALGMAMIAEHAMRNPIFRRIVATKVSELPPDPSPRVYYNQNQLLYDYPGAVGIKIGYTIEADETIVGAARRHGELLIAVLLHDTPAGLWPDVEHLLTWGFQNFREVTAIRRGQTLGTVTIGHRRVHVVASRAVEYLEPRGRTLPVRWRLAPLKPDDARPIPAGTVVGRASVRIGSRTIATIPAINPRRVQALPPPIHWTWGWLVFPAAVAAASFWPRKSREPSRLARGGPTNG
ncbi:MAG: D-alanyl-D-alanine carboxypeptidase [Firmicutes bacterium]|nr:D-alanyl-D-alanine carboxypeptidase [Bacillota bacterium]